MIILVSGELFKQEHNLNIEIVFTVLMGCRFKVIKSKVFIASIERVISLGHIIDNTR